MAWVGIGCGSLVLIGIIVIAAAAMFFGPKAKKLAEEFELTAFPSGTEDVMPNRWPLPSVPE